MPIVTVLMPVYNAGKFLRDAVDSILKQSFSDFEFLIIDDGSTDESQSIIRSYKDSRIKFVQNEKNLGVAATLNRGLALARGEYIARMDADDLSDPTRLEKQLNFLEKHRSLGLIGSWVRYFNRQKSYVLRYPVGVNCVRAYVLLGNPLAHPSVMIRKDIFKKYGLRYDETCVAAQDYELWQRCVTKFAFDNIPDPLVHWRANEEGVTQARFIQSNEQTLCIQKQELERLGIIVSEKELKMHREIGNGSGFDTLKEIEKAVEWLDKLVKVNDQKGVYPKEGLRQAAAFAWFRICVNSSGLGFRVLKMYWRSCYRSYYNPGVKEFLQLIMNALFKFRKESVGKPGT